MLASLCRRCGVRQRSELLAWGSSVRYFAGKQTSGSNQATESKKTKKSTSFVNSLYTGQMVSSSLFPYPDVLSKEERSTLELLVDPVNKYFEEVNNPAKNDVSGIPPEQMKQMGELGLFGLQVPSELNGLGVTNTMYARLVEIVGKHDLGVGITLGAHQSIGFKGILLFGNEQQKKKYLPKLATGENIAAFALTEPSSGSDASSIRTRAVLSEDGKNYILNGSKLWISNGSIADVFTVFAQTEWTDPKTGEKRDKVTAFIVERNFGGVTSGPPMHKMGINASNTSEVYLENVKVPVENVLVGPGEGFKIAMAILNNGRFGMVAALTGTMKQLISYATEHANNRTQFGKKLKEFAVIKEKLAHMAARTYVSESLAYLISGIMDSGSTEFQLEAAIGKVYASESAWYVADEAVQILGGMGYMKDMPLERVVRDLRIFRIFEGTNEILRLFVALNGVQATGNRLKEVKNSIQSFQFPEVVGEVSNRLGRLFGSTNNAIVSNSHPKLQESAKLLQAHSNRFVNIVENLAMKFGKNIVDEQILLRRISDATIEMYCMAAVLSRATRALSAGSPTAEQEEALTNFYCRIASARIQQYLTELETTHKTTDPLVHSIANAVFQSGGFHVSHPVD